DVGLIGSQVENVDNLFGIGDTVERDSRIVAQVDHGLALQVVEGFLAMNRDGAKSITFEEPKIAERGLADARRIFQHRVEDLLKLAGGSRNGLQQLSRCGLLL